MTQIQILQGLNKLVRGEKKSINKKRTCSFIRMTRVRHEWYDFTPRALLQKIFSNLFPIVKYVIYLITETRREAGVTKMGSSSIILIFLYFSILGKPEYELMQTAWRERNQDARIKNAKEAIALNPECATAYILLAEEEAVDITG